MIREKQTNDQSFSNKENQVQALVDLAERLMGYGQVERAYAVLDLADWLSPQSPEIRKQRIIALVKLERWDEALDYIVDGHGTLNNNLAALIHWRNGRVAAGDDIFLST